MTHEIFLMRVMHRTGLDDQARAQVLTDHVVNHLANCLSQPQAEAVASQLPTPIASRLIEQASGDGCDLDTLYHSVAEQLDVDISAGLECTQVVFQVIGEALGTSGRMRLVAALDDDWSHLFKPRQTPTTPPGNRRHDRRTLSSSEPGSARPISEAQPGHRNSIAHTDHPQLGTKLSTSHGAPSRRTLAEGKPGSSRPISEN